MKEDCKNYEACQTYQCYFPQEDSWLGIGAMTIIPGGLEEEVSQKSHFGKEDKNHKL